MSYEEQLAEKVQRLNEKFAAFEPPRLEVFRSPPQHYRQRAEFRVWHEADESFFVMFAPPRGKPYRVDHLPAASMRINDLMAALREEIVLSPIVRKKLFQVEFLTTLNGDAMVVLIYHRPLDAQWADNARELERRLNAAVIGRSRRQRVVLSRETVVERLTVGSRSLVYLQGEDGFTQPNASVNQHMLAWADRVTASLGGRDLLELYCGNGNFTCVLAANFRRVLATEVSKTSVKLALRNLSANGINNVAIARLASDEIASALRRERRFRRLNGIDLDGYRFDCVLVDPPRSGLDDAARNLIARFPSVLYVSCNPDTLYQDLEQLSSRSRIARFALFDQFPFTSHIECGVLLSH